MTGPVTVEQTWFCECGVVGTFIHYSDAHAGQVKEGVLLQHRRLAPECPANDVPPIRFRERPREKSKGEA